MTVTNEHASRQLFYRWVLYIRRRRWFRFSAGRIWFFVAGRSGQTTLSTRAVESTCTLREYVNIDSARTLKQRGSVAALTVDVLVYAQTNVKPRELTHGVSGKVNVGIVWERLEKPEGSKPKDRRAEAWEAFLVLGDASPFPTS